MISNKSLKLLAILAAIVASFSGRYDQVMACSSCGSGSGDPLILNPYENYKVYGALAFQPRLEDVDQNSEAKPAAGAESKASLSFAAAFRLNPELFVSINASYLRLTKDGEQESGFGDPFLALRYTPLSANFARIWQPQVQLLARYKKAQQVSIHDSEGISEPLKIRSTGFDEKTLGVDLWWGSHPVLMFGMTYSYTFEDKTETDFGSLEQSAVANSVVTVGTRILKPIKTLVGWTRERREFLTLNQNRLPNSEKYIDGQFLTIETQYPQGSNWRLTLSQQGYWGDSVNTGRFKTYSLAWMHNFL